MPPATSTPASPRSPAASDEDNALLTLASTGATDAFATLFHRYYPAIHAFAYRLCLCSVEAEDVAQETFIQAARSLNTFRRDASFKNWLYTIATNRSRDRQRQRRRRDRLDSALAAEPVPESDEHPALASTPFDSRHAIQAALSGLTSDQREAVTLVYYENLSHAEAARILGCAESTVSWRIFRAKTKLKKILRAPASSRHA